MAEFFVLSKRRMYFIIGILSIFMIFTILVKSHWNYTSTLRIQENEIKQKVKKSSPCQEYTETSQCARCSKEEMRSLKKECMETGFKQAIKCQDGSEHFLWCDISPAVEESAFWRFQAFTLGLGLLSYAVVYSRQQRLDQKLMDKIHKQISSGI